MAMQPIQANEAWQQFQRLAHHAKIRNAGFNLPLKPKKAPVKAALPKDPRNVETVVHSMKKLYDIQTPERQKPVLGTRFDSYA